MNRKITSYGQAMMLFDALGVEETTSKTQKKNGTRRFELPNPRFDGSGKPYKIKLSSYASGYVRNASGHLFTCYQLNRVRKKIHCRWNPFAEKFEIYTTSHRVMIPMEKNRIIFLANFILRNYYSDKYCIVSNYDMLRMAEMIDNRRGVQQYYYGPLAPYSPPLYHVDR